MLRFFNRVAAQGLRSSGVTCRAAAAAHHVAVAYPTAIASPCSGPHLRPFNDQSTTSFPHLAGISSESREVRVCKSLLAPRAVNHARGLADIAVGSRGGLGFEPSLLDSIVKVFTVHSAPNFYMPWQMKPQRESSGSGFVVRPGAILTNAHVVADASFVMVKRHGSSQRFAARVVCVGHECDLALLEVEEEEFWGEEMTPLPMGGIPELQDAVAVAGFPQGGDNVSVTGGVVSRVDLTQYVHGAARLMAIQIDAAINPGNSGGPAIAGRSVVGVAFQNLRNAEGIGYIIPTCVIDHFLADYDATGRYVGFCSLGVRCQSTENPMLRASLSIPPSSAPTGVLVSHVRPMGAAAGVLRSGDVLLEFDGTPISADGTVAFRHRERISFDHLVGMRQAGERALVSVLRNGELTSLPVTLIPLSPLVPVHMYDRVPSYFIFAGLVFVPLTQPYLHEHGDDWFNTCPRPLCEKAINGEAEWEGEEVVLLSQVLMDAVNAGYQGLRELQVLRCNGTPVLNLRHLKSLMEAGLAGEHGGYIRLQLDDHRLLVIDPEQITCASQRVLSRHRIPAPQSADLDSPPSFEELQHWAAFESATASKL